MTDWQRQAEHADTDESKPRSLMEAAAKVAFDPLWQGALNKQQALANEIHGLLRAFTDAELLTRAEHAEAHVEALTCQLRQVGGDLNVARTRQAELEVEIEALTRSLQGVEHELRKEWWLNHGVECCTYGDDGEMQCCCLDFKRDPIDGLRVQVNTLRAARVIARTSTGKNSREGFLDILASLTATHAEGSVDVDAFNAKMGEHFPKEET